MPRYDLFVYHDFEDTLNDQLEIGDDAGKLLGDTFQGLRVAAVGPPIHDTKDAAVVLSHGPAPMRDVQAFLERS